MATETKTIKKCDVYGVTRGVETYTVTVRGPSLDSSRDVYLGPRALERLTRMMDAATKPPRRKATGALPL